MPEKVAAWLIGAACFVLLLAAILFIHQTQPAHAQTNNNVTTYADITGDGGVHALAASGSCRAIQLTAGSANTGTARTGDANISTTRGQPIPANGGFYYKEGPGLWNLANTYYLVASSDKLSIACIN